MKRILFVLTIALNSFFIANGQNNDLLWVSHFTGTGTNQPVTITSDVSGNIYVFGNFTGTVNQDALSLTSVGLQDAFIAKYNKNGQIVWLKAITGAATESAVSIVMSNDGNYFYVSGTTNGTASFDGNTIVSAGGLDVFLAKYATDGTLQWVHRTAYGAGNQGNGAIAIDPSGNIVQVGVFTATVTFYGGVTTLVDASGFRQNFFAKYDTDGNLLWAKQIQDDNSATFAKTVTACASGYYISGNYQSSLYLDIDTITSSGLNDGFLYKTDSNGNGILLRKFAGVTGDETINRHRCDANGYQFLIGYYSSATLTVDSLTGVTSAKTFPNAGSNDIFYACFAPDGTLQFANSYGSTGDDQGLAVFPDANHIIIGGKYSTAVSFDSFNLTNSGLTDCFMVETDRNGVVLSANAAAGTSNEQINSANIDFYGLNLYVGEFFSATITIGSTTLSCAGANRDMFLARFGTINLSFAVTSVLCNSDSSGAVDLTVSGDGAPPYTYLWSNAATTEDISLVPAGWYTVTVTDANGATKVDSAQVTEPASVALFFTVTDTKCPASTDGAIDLTVVGGTPPYTFLWTGGITTEDLSGLAAGTYDVTVTDAGLCTKTGSASVSNPASMILSSVITSPTCVPGSDGAVDLTVFNGTGPFTYIWSNLAVTQDISALVSGTYDVTVTDANLCSVTGSYDVINPSAPQVMTTQTELTCVPGSDAAIDVIVSGGTIPYTYLWNDAVITQDRSGLPAGSYAVTVTDAASCSATTATIVFSTPPSPSVSFVNSDPSCVPGSDGAIDLIVYSGTPPYTYSWTGGIITEDISSLVEGTYYITVTDSKGCSVVDSSAVSRQFPAATITASGSTTFCSGGTVQLNANTGTGLSYQWQLTGVDIAGAVAGSYVASAAGDYTVVVTGTNGCSTTSGITTVTVNSLPTAYNMTGGGSYCSGGTGVSVGLSSSDAGVNYELFLDGVTTTNILAGTGASLDFGVQTTAGNYTVIATNASLCTLTMNGNSDVTVNSLPVATITASGPLAFCSGGSVQLNATNSPGYSYQWQESAVDIVGATSPSYTATVSGNYTVIITNISACTDTSAATVVTVSAVPLATITPAGSTTFCTGDSVQLDANAGGGYTYQWQLNTVDIIGETGQSYMANTAGDYTVVVTDAGCSNVSAPTTVTVNAIPVTTVTANGPVTFCSGGSVQLNATNSPGYSYQWQESAVDIAGATSPSYTTSASGSYTVIINNINGCSDTSAITTVTVNPLPAIYNITGGGSYCSGGSGATVGLSSSNNGVNYELFLNGSTTANILPGSGASLDFGLQTGTGTYTVIATDTTTNCMSTMNGSANVDTVLPLTAILNAHTLVIFCGSNSNGEATFTTQNGLQPYTYTWSASVSTGAYANDLGIGINYVTVSDGCGTSIVDSIVISSLPVMEASITSSTQANCAASADGSATVTTSGGVAPFSYNWSGSASVINIASDLAAGWQYVTISDYCGSIIDSVEITSIPALAISSTSLITEVTCTGDSNGTAVVITTGGVAPFTFSWSTFETNDTAVTLVEGYNYVTVTDGCSSLIDSVLMTVTLPLSIAITSYSPTSCPGGNNGGATVTVANGAAPITYQWSTNNLFSDTLNTNAFATNLINGLNFIKVTDVCTLLIDSVQILSLPVVTDSITFSVPASCPNSADGKATVTVLNGAPPYTYVWSPPSTSTGSVAMDLIPGWSYVTVTDQCGNSDIDSVNISNLPALSINASSLSMVTCQGLTNGSGMVIKTDGVAPFTYLWSSTETNDTAVALVEGYNYVSVTDACGTIVDSVNISVTPVVTATYDKPDGILCYGDTSATIEVNPVNGITPYTYIWGDSPLTTFDRSNLGAGKYYFTVTDNCLSTYVDSVVVNQPGALSLSMITTNVSFTGLSDGAIDLLISGGTQPYSYYWSNTVIIEDLQNIPEGQYKITVTDNNGCVITDSSTIVTDSWHIEIYNAFSPNGDGKNDVWNIKYISAYPDCEITIFDEWGIKVFESTGYATAWDGTSRKGSKLPAATYYYIIDIKDGSKPFTGSVAILK